MICNLIIGGVKASDTQFCKLRIELCTISYKSEE